MPHLTWKSFYRFILPSNRFLPRAKERESQRTKRLSKPKERASKRERERERESPDRKERGRRDFAGDHRPSSSLTIAPRRSSIATPPRSLIAALCRSISPPISPSPPPRNLNLTGFYFIFLLGFVSFVNECGIDSLSACLQLRKCMENWVAWLCKAFSVKMFERTKHRNWFSVKRILRQPNSLNTFFFPENSISEKYLFSRKYFTGTKHSLIFSILVIIFKFRCLIQVF